MTTVSPAISGSGRTAADPQAAARSRRAARLAHPLTVGTAVSVAVGYVAAVDPNRPGHYPLCPVRALTGYYCPGCGGLRAVHDLTHGHLQAALSANLLVVLAIPVAIIFWGIWARARLRRQPLALRIPSWILCSIPVVLIVFGVLRNLPGMTGLAP
jgi:hypothetical protein